jgi:hypothetical protein
MGSLEGVAKANQCVPHMSCRHGALVFQWFRQHRSRSAAQKTLHPSAHRYRTDSTYLR